MAGAINQNSVFKNEPIPGTPIPESEQIYALTYKKGSVVTTIHFKCAGDIKTAQKKGSEYCDRRKLRFIWVSSFITDLDAEIKKLEAES